MNKKEIRNQATAKGYLLGLFVGACYGVAIGQALSEKKRLEHEQKARQSAMDRQRDAAVENLGFALERLARDFGSTSSELAKEGRELVFAELRGEVTPDVPLVQETSPSQSER